MGVVVVAEVLEVVAHVLGGVDLEVLSLSVLDLESVRVRVLEVLAQEGGDHGAVGHAVVELERALVAEGGSEEREQAPADGHLLEALHAEDGFSAEPEAREPGEVVVPGHAVVQAVELDSVFDGDVVGEQVHLLAAVAEEVEVLEAVILDVVLLEPGAAGDLGNSAEVSEWGNLVKHL